MKKLTVLLAAGLIALLFVPVQAMAPHELDFASLRLPGGAATLWNSSIAPENDRSAWFSGDSHFGPSLAAWYSGGKPPTTGTAGEDNIAQDVVVNNPDTRPRDPIPEPATMILLGSGLMAGGLAARRYFVR